MIIALAALLLAVVVGAVAGIVDVSEKTKSTAP
jgi:hypothetical protein